MGILIQTTDFTGKHKIAQDCYTDLQAYIDKYEKKYLLDLLGATVYALFVADINEATMKPVTAKYLTLYNEFMEDEGDIIIFSEGLKEMLIGFIFFEFVKDYKFKITRAGVLVSNSDQNREAAWTEFDIYTRYNDAISTYNAIQWYIKSNRSEYPTYNGQTKGIAHWAC